MGILSTLGHFSEPKSSCWIKSSHRVWPVRDCSAHTREPLGECSLAIKQVENQPCLWLFPWCLLERLKAQFHWRERALMERNGRRGTATLLNTGTSQKPLLHWAPATWASNPLTRGEFPCRIPSQRLFLSAGSFVCALVFPAGSVAHGAPHAREGGRAPAPHPALIRTFELHPAPLTGMKNAGKDHWGDAGVWFKSLWQAFNLISLYQHPALCRIS